jgi:hypothetical protein
MTQLWLATYIKDTGRTPYPSVSYFLYFPQLPELVLIIELGFPPVYSSELPLQAERAIPYLSTLLLVRTCEHDSSWLYLDPDQVLLSQILDLTRLVHIEHNVQSNLDTCWKMLDHQV